MRTTWIGGMLHIQTYVEWMHDKEAPSIIKLFDTEAAVEEIDKKLSACFSGNRFSFVCWYCAKILIVRARFMSLIAVLLKIVYTIEEITFNLLYIIPVISWSFVLPAKRLIGSHIDTSYCLQSDLYCTTMLETGIMFVKCSKGHVLQFVRSGTKTPLNKNQFWI